MLIDGWRREQVLGSGAFGVIVLWRNTTTGQRLAIKQCRWVNTPGFGHAVVDAAPTVSRTQKDRWRQEVELMKRLSHPHVVAALPVPSSLDSRVTDLPCLGMEYCDGGDLRKRLSRAEFANGLPEPCVRRLLDQLSAALLYLHSLRIIHRDLKPENVVLSSRADGSHDYKLIDLGYCKELDQSSLASSFVGTLQYLAPELFTEKSYSTAVDNWSFGLLVHEVLTGRRPFLANATPAQWLPVIRSKKSEDIVAYYDDTAGVGGGVVYEQEISSLTHVSHVLKRDMEKFLRTVLEYEPKKRGGKDAFVQLRRSLAKPLVSVFVMNSLQVLSFEVIAESSKLSDLKIMIERATGCQRQDQVLLVPSDTAGSRSLFFGGGSETAVDDQLLVKCLNMSLMPDCLSTTADTAALLSTPSPSPSPSPNSLSPPLAPFTAAAAAGPACGSLMQSLTQSRLPDVPAAKCIFLFHRSQPLSFTQYSVTSSIPPLVEKVLLNPTRLVTYDDQKQAWSQFLWLAQVIIKKHNLLVQGHMALLLHSHQLRESVRSKMCDAVRSSARLSARMDVMREEAHAYGQSQGGSQRGQQDKKGATAAAAAADQSLKCELMSRLLATEVKDYGHELRRLDESYVSRCRRLEAIGTRAVNVTFDPHRTDCESIYSQCYRDKSKMYAVYSSMLSLLEDARKKGKEDRNRIVKAIGSTHAFDNTPMVKLLVDLFQLLEKLIRDNYVKVTALIEITGGLNAMGKEMSRITANCKKTESALRSMHESFLQTVTAAAAAAAAATAASATAAGSCSIDEPTYANCPPSLLSASVNGDGGHAADGGSSSCCQQCSHDSLSSDSDDAQRRTTTTTHAEMRKMMMQLNMQSSSSSSSRLSSIASNGSLNTPAIVGSDPDHSPCPSDWTMLQVSDDGTTPSSPPATALLSPAAATAAAATPPCIRRS